MMWLVVGKIVAPQGLNGELRIYPDSDFPERFLQPGPRWLRSPGAEPKPVDLSYGRFVPGKGLYVIKLEGIDYRDQAEALRHWELLVPEADRLALEEGEFHVADLIGLRVFDQIQQADIGVVTNVFTAGNDLLEVELDSADPAKAAETAETAEANEIGLPAAPPPVHKDQRKSKRPKARSRKSAKSISRRVLIPFVEAIVPVVDLQAGRVEIVPLTGLLDI